MKKIENILEDLNYSFVGELQRKSISQFNNKLEDYIKNNLMQLGYKFTSQIDFYEFCKQRITRVRSSMDWSNSYELYLDFDNKINTGILIGSYSDKFKIVDKGNKVTVIIG